MEVEGIFEEHKERMRGFFAGKLKRKRKGKQGAKNELFIGGEEVQELSFFNIKWEASRASFAQKMHPFGYPSHQASSLSP